MISVDGTDNMGHGSTEPIVDQSPASIMAYSDDGGLDFNDLAMWSEHTFFDMPFAGTSSAFPAAWDDFLPFDLNHEVHQTALQSHTDPDGMAHRVHHHDGNSTTISRAPSPPNEASGEDKTPFAWSPSSKRITAPKEVRLDRQDPLLHDIDTRFALNIEAYITLKTRVSEQLSYGGGSLLTALLMFPERPVVNAFLTAFSKHYLPQAPVLHPATLVIDHLPDFLLAAMISIGATYCHRKNARRFAIVLQDWARCRLSLAIEADNSLLRSSTTVYASALICYAGLWCGNKRAYELAEALRGSVVTWLRRLGIHHTHHNDSDRTPESDMNKAWTSWVREESSQRLQWMVYALDCQYATLMNMPPMMSLSELQEWQCPCDEEFWQAASARKWKSLLGRATVPPGREFATAIKPFISVRRSEEPPSSCNKWTAFLLLLTVNVLALQRIEQARFLSHLASLDIEDEHIAELAITADKDQQLSSSLYLWQQCYGRPRVSESRQSRFDFFDIAGQDVYDLCRLQLQVSVMDLQDILGKSGADGIQSAKSRFSAWLARDSPLAHTIICDTVAQLTHYHFNAATEKSRSVGGDAPSVSAPYSSVHVFLAYAFLYACSLVTSPEQKAAIYEYVSRAQTVCDRTACHDLLEMAFSQSAAANKTPGREVLRSGAEVLSKFRNWACSLNLALLLHWRSKL